MDSVRGLQFQIKTFKCRNGEVWSTSIETLGNVRKLQYARPYFFYLWLTDFGPCPSKRRGKKQVEKSI